MLRRTVPTLLGGLVGLVALLAALPARADVLKEFTGYTRPGVPSGRVVTEKGMVRLVVDQGDVTSPLLGGTVHFMVIDLRDRQDDELWLGAVRDMVKAFKPGEDGAGRSSPDYDGGARYLYLYQTVNDMPATETGVRSSSVFLIDPALVTSWGHFVGSGFSLEEVEHEKRVVRPVSSTHVVDRERWEYRNPDGEHPSAQLRGIDKYASIDRSGIRVGTGDDPVRSPDTVVLVAGVAAFERSSLMWAPAGTYHAYPVVAPVEVLPRPALMAPAADVPGALAVDRANRSYLRTSWLNANVLRPRERSALYGFTSNHPPIYDDVQLRGVKMTGVKPAADVGGPAATVSVAPVGRVPAPVAPPEQFVGLMSLGGGVGWPGGVLPGGGGGGGFGFPPPGLVSIPTGGGGGGFGGGNGGGHGGPGPARGEQQGPSPVTVNVNVQQTANPQQTVVQQQTQSNTQTQSQAQSLSQQQVHTQQAVAAAVAEVIPEPAAFLSALLGLPAVWLLRRRKASPSV